VLVDGDEVMLLLPPAEALDELLSTELGCHLATSCATAPPAPPACEMNGHSSAVAVL
jgi:hypothetical protein